MKKLWHCLGALAMCVALLSVDGCGPFWVNPYITVEQSNLNWMEIHYYNTNRKPIRRVSLSLAGSGHVEIKKSMATASFEDQKAAAIKELAETFSVSTAVATQMADAGFLSVDGIVGEDEASFIAATGLDEVTAKGIYAAAQAVAKLMAGEEAVDA